MPVDNQYLPLSNLMCAGDVICFEIYKSRTGNRIKKYSFRPLPWPMVYCSLMVGEGIMQKIFLARNSAREGPATNQKLPRRAQEGILCYQSLS